ncbi:MAG: phosphodiester glycosidase family protein [Chloroflexi bacterium]|nr:phosphodiester glycosidase family protein [Chloroflexota bacterium]
MDGSTPPVPDVPPVSSVPNYDNKKWYRVTASALNVRATPGGAIIGTLLKDDTLPAMDDTTNPSWIQIERMDGLKGWCSRTYLVALGTPRPASIRQSLFTGVTYLRNDLKTPRLNALHILVIDVLSLNLEFLVTPSTGGTPGVICSRTTSKFLDEFKLHFAINADGFSSLDPATFPPASVCPNGGNPVRVNGFAASRGVVYSPEKTIQPEIYLSSTNRVTVETPPATVFNAFAGERMVVENGVMVKNLASLAPSPRTALGLNQSGRWLSLFVIDGYQPGYSEGVTFPELASLLISYGIYTGINLDGGSSSTMVIRGVDGAARLVNSPIDMAIPGRQRAVGNHLGAFIKK